MAKRHFSLVAFLAFGANCFLFQGPSPYDYNEPVRRMLESLPEELSDLKALNTDEAPYMHDGSQKTLEEVVEWYAKSGYPNPILSDKIKKLDLTA